MKFFASRLLLLAAAASPAVGLLDCFGTDSPFVKHDDAIVSNSNNAAVTWKYCMKIPVSSQEDHGDEVLLYYSPNPDEQTVQLGLHASSSLPIGWSALALAGNGGMKGASHIVVRQVTDDNDTNKEWVAEDRHSLDYTMPSLDDQQDVELLFAQQPISDDTTTVAWGVKVPMDSCDPDDYAITDRVMFLLYAMGEDTSSFGFHGHRRGQFHINLMQAPPQEEIPSFTPRQQADSNTGPMLIDMDADQDLIVRDLVMPNVSLALGPGGEDATNPYKCTFFDLAQMRHDASTSMMHVTRIDPVINTKYVHHIVLFGCDPDMGFEDANVQHLDVVDECQGMPQGCFDMRTAWAVGGGSLIMPEGVGLPIGANNNRFLLMQMHYYNPDLDANVYDDSGLRAYMTPNLKQEEAGTILLNSGVGDFQRDPLPMGQPEVFLDPPMVVPSFCTKPWTQPLNIMGVFHHMHVLGKQMTIGVERDGRSLGPLRTERAYDFKHQTAEEANFRQLLPGDALTLDCSYDTTTAKANVTFGDFTQQEMCVAFVMYWPRQTVAESFSFIPQRLPVELCLEPAKLLEEDVSACTEAYFGVGPTFFDIDPGFEVDALTMCNSPTYETTLKLDTMREGYHACPEACSATQSCTRDDIIQHGQDVVCHNQCKYGVGVSQYPDLSDTEPNDQMMYGCVDPEIGQPLGREVISFKTPALKEPPACVPKGTVKSSLPSVVIAEKEDQDHDDGDASETMNAIDMEMTSTTTSQAGAPTSAANSSLNLLVGAVSGIVGMILAV